MKKGILENKLKAEQDITDNEVVELKDEELEKVSVGGSNGVFESAGNLNDCSGLVSYVLAGQKLGNLQK
ncbi:MAG: hypothetical protein MJ247_01110 [Alphaproteobacteria bacterium]|nr:hypothetical protein [Alphaproteobacteria bacterium]